MAIDPDDLDDDTLERYEDLAEAWGVEVEDVLELEEQFGYSVEGFGEWESGDLEPPDPDYMEYLADAYDMDISDLYDLYYGYAPGAGD